MLKFLEMMRNASCYGDVNKAFKKLGYGSAEFYLFSATLARHILDTFKHIPNAEAHDEYIQNILFPANYEDLYFLIHLKDTLIMERGAFSFDISDNKRFTSSVLNKLHSIVNMLLLIGTPFSKKNNLCSTYAETAILSFYNMCCEWKILATPLLQEWSIEFFSKLQKERLNFYHLLKNKLNPIRFWKEESEELLFSE